MKIILLIFFWLPSVFADCNTDTDSFDNCLKCCGGIAEVSDKNEQNNFYKITLAKACAANKATLNMKVDSGKSNLSWHEANVAVSAVSLQHACKDLESPNLITYSECVKKCDSKKSSTVSSDTLGGVK